MKNRYFILSVLFWAIASAVFAVTLPSTSYQSSYLGESGATENIMIGSGTSFNQVYLTAANTEFADACSVYEDEEECVDCCVEFENTCMGDTECYDKVYLCKSTCMGVSLPLGTPLLLLPFIAIYAVIRKRKEAQA